MSTMNNKKKILIACSCYYPDVKGGGEVSTKLLAEALSEKGYQVVVVAVSDHDSVDEVNGIKVYRVRFKNLYWTYEKDKYSGLKKIAWHIIDSHNIQIAKCIVKIAKEESVSALITSTIEDISPATWKLAKKEGIKVYHILRSYNLICATATMFKNDQNCDRQCSFCKALTLMKRVNSKYVDHLIGISSFVLNIHKDFGYFQNATSCVIHNICGEIAENPDNILHWIPSERSNIKFGYIGNLLPTKGIEKIFSALSKSGNSRFELVIAGKGSEEYTENLKSLVKRLNISVTFLGHTEPEKFFRSIDVLIVPSVWNEPFGRIIVESYSCNVPVIASNRGGIPELITADTGFLYEDEDQLCAKLEFIASNNLKFDFSKKSSFNPSFIASKWAEILPLNTVNDEIAITR